MNREALQVVLVTRRYRPWVGGAERLLERLANELAAQGADVSVVTARWDKGWPAKELQGPVRVERLPMRRERFVGTWSWMRGLEGWLREHRDRFDVCYVSMLKHSAYAAVGAGQALGFPVVVRAEGAGGVGDVAWQRQANFGRRIARRVRHADAFVALNDEVAEELRAAGYPQERIVLIPNGVPVPPPRDMAERQAYRRHLRDRFSIELAAETPIAVFAGRLSPEKELPTLVEAWGRLTGTHRRATLLLLGDGPMREQLSRAISDAGLDGRIHMLGNVDDVEPIQRAADVFVLPSSQEGMSIALLEAMALGLPVVASDIPGNRRVLQAGAEGVLVPPRDAAGLVSAIRSVLEAPDCAQRMATAARARVEGEFSLARMAEAHRALFTRLVAEHRPN